MIVCPECGTRNEDGELFCGQCGTYLEWGEEGGAPAGTPLEEPAAAEPAVPDPVATTSPAEPARERYADVAAEPAVEPVRGAPVAGPGAEPVAAAPAVEPPSTPADVPAAGSAAVAPDPVVTPDPVVAPVAETPDDAGVDVPHPRVATHRAEVAGVALADPPPAAAPAPSDSGPGAQTSPSGLSGGAVSPTGPAAGSAPAGGSGPAGSGVPSSTPDTATAAAPAAASSAAPTGAPTAASATAGTATPADRPPVTERIRPAEETAAIVAPPATPARPATPAGPSGPGATRPGDAPVRPTTPTPPPQTPDARIAAAAALVAPPPPPPAPTAPAAVRPGVPKPPPAPKKVAADEPPPAPGDLICGSCGAGNVPTRKFCRRCGASLAEAKVQARRSWWSRLWRPEPKAGPVAGYRPRARRRFPTRPVVAIVVIGALVALVLSFRPEIERGRITLLDRIQGNVAVNPTSEVASSEAPGHEAAKIRDGATNLAWSPAAPGDGVGQFVDFTFAEPFRLTRLLVIPGASDVEKDYLAGSSPKTLSLTAVTSSGTQQTVQIPLEDKVGLQNASLGIDDVVAIRLAIAATYRAEPTTSVSIAEVEFRGRT